MAATLRSILLQVLSLLVGFALMQMGNTLQGTLLSVRGGIEGFSPFEVGLVGACFWGGIVYGSVRSGPVIRRVGHIRAFAALGAIASTIPLLHLLLIHPIAWMILRAATGFCFAALFIVVESWLNGFATSATRGRVLSIYGMTGLIAGVSGQMLLPVTDPAGFKSFCIVAITIAFSLVPIALTGTTAPSNTDGSAKINPRSLYGHSPFGTVAAFLSGVTTGAFFTLGPVFAQRRGLNTAEIAIFMSAGTLGGFLMALPLGWLSDRIDRRLVVIAAAVTAVAMLLGMIVIVPHGAYPWVLYLCVAIFGATIVPVYSIILAQVSDVVPKEELVAASGGLLLLQGTGATVGPVVAGLAMSASLRGLPYTLIAAQILIALWGLYTLLLRRAGPAADRKGKFQVEPPVPVATTLVSAHAVEKRRGNG
ncbi:MAG TPA: MFS transporter [Pseudolabrys sp.]|nr:MFS transporter [Pseudolabrys sp.]